VLLKKKGTAKPFLNQNIILRLGYSLFFINYNFTAVVQLTFKPMGVVSKVRLTGGLTSYHVWGIRFVVSSTFATTGLGVSSFWVCHILIVLRLSA